MSLTSKDVCHLDLNNYNHLDLNNYKYLLDMLKIHNIEFDFQYYSGAYKNFLEISNLYILFDFILTVDLCTSAIINEFIMLSGCRYSFEFQKFVGDLDGC